MKVSETRLPGVLLIETDVFGDKRGQFLELWHSARYSDHMIKSSFVQANFSKSRKGVLRGLHYQLNQPQGKLVSVTLGEVFDVVVDVRPGSPTYGHWMGKVLSETNHWQLYIPPGYAHGFCVLSEEAHVMYFCTQWYNPDDEHGVRWDDEKVNIQWPIPQPILSEKDRQYASLALIPESNLPVWHEEK